MLTRRTLLAASGLAVIPSTLAAVPAAAKTFQEPAQHRQNATFFEAPGWDKEIIWLPGTRPDGYQWTVSNAPPLSRSNLNKSRLTYQCLANYADTTHDSLSYHLFHGEPVKEPNWMRGLSSYYNTLDPNTAQNAVNVLDALGANHKPKTSVYLIHWNEKTAALIAPILMGGRPVYVKGVLKTALMLKDWRYVVRVANVDFDIDTATLQSYLHRALYRMPTTPRSNTAFYMSTVLKDRARIADRCYDVPVRGVQMLNIHEDTVA